MDHGGILGVASWRIRFFWDVSAMDSDHITRVPVNRDGPRIERSILTNLCGTVHFAT
jgi:hypothetical protein